MLPSVRPEVMNRNLFVYTGIIAIKAQSNLKSNMITIFFSGNSGTGENGFL